MKRLLFTVLFLWVALAHTEGQTFPWFTNTYGPYGTNFISIAPWTAQGVFYEGDTITINNKVRTAIQVYDFHFNLITNSPPPVVLSHLGLGHYFIQVNGIGSGVGDRAQFTILPKGYTNHPHSDIGEMPTFGSGLIDTCSNRFARLAPGFSRLTLDWAQCSNALGIVVAGTNDWTAADQFVHSYTNVPWAFDNAPLKVLGIGVYHTNLCITPLQDQTNSLSSWIHDVATIYSNAAVRYGTNAVYEILNEPGSGNIDFRAPYNEDPHWTGASGGVLPAAMAVSAAVQAIKFQCPNCVTWGPAARGFTSWASVVLTSDFVRAYYAHVDVLSFHDADGLYGPVDSTTEYNGSGEMIATDLSDEYMASLYPGKPFAVTECYPYSPSALGKTNGWCVISYEEGGSGPGDVPNWAWDWRTMCMRFWKDLLMGKAAGVRRVQMFLGLDDGGYGLADDGSHGWDVNGGRTDGIWIDFCGGGPRPTVDGQAMISWWFNNAKPLANWLSGSVLTVVDPLGGYTNGISGLHFYEWQFADGSTNTIIWADEETTVTTNFGVGLTDIFSNEWTGPIGIEPVIAWGWPNNRQGGSSSIVPEAAFSASPTDGPVPITVTFTDNSSGAITNRYWEFGDGFVTNTPELTVVHQYATPGSYTVQLIVSGPSGASIDTESNLVVATDSSLPTTGGGVNGLSPVTGGTAGGTSSAQSGNRGGNSTWRLLITY